MAFKWVEINLEREKRVENPLRLEGSVVSSAWIKDIFRCVFPFPVCCKDAELSGEAQQTLNEEEGKRFIIHPWPSFPFIPKEFSHFHPTYNYCRLTSTGCCSLRNRLRVFGKGSLVTQQKPSSISTIMQNRRVQNGSCPLHSPRSIWR